MGRGSSKAGGTSLKGHFESEDDRIEKFMSKRVSGMGEAIEMTNGQIIEHYPMKYMMEQLKDFKANGELSGDDGIAILYKNGRVEAYGDSDSISEMKLTGIKGVIYDNEATLAYAGTGMTIENLNETLANEKTLYGNTLNPYGKNKDEDDWRITFE